MGLDISLDELIDKVGTTDNTVKECAFDANLIWIKITKSQIKSIFKKFSLDKYRNIGRIKLKVPIISDK